MNDGNAEQSNDSVGSPADSKSEAPEATSAAPAPAAGAPAKAATNPPKQHGWLRKFFWLDERVADAEKKGFSKASAGWGEFELARQARAGIVQIGETGEGNGAVLLLERAEVLFLVRSHLAKQNHAPVGMTLSEEDWENARKVPAVAEAWGELSGAQQTALQAGLGPQAELALVNVDLKQRRYLASALRKLAASLAEPLEREASLVGRVLFMRWARLAAAALVLLAIAWTISGTVEKRFAKPNIALGRPVTISTQFADAALDHTLLVDGDRTNLGFHTDNGPNQWVTIDLGSPKSISKVVVYNRVECCQERAVPLRLEVSDDNVNFKKVVDRTEEFDVWTAKGLDIRGRYVRLRHLGANFLHLAEVEIY
jgi:hypothetical protein